MKTKKSNKTSHFISLSIIALLISCSTSDLVKPDIYSDISGIHIAGGDGGSHYWKNGLGVDINKKQFSTCQSVYVCQNKVYVAGTSYETNFNATCWVNGVPTILTDKNTLSEGYAVFVKDTNVYVSGVIDNKAVYWKNGRVVKLQGKSGANDGSNAYSIFVKDTNVYVVGNSTYFGENIDVLPVYWLNGKIHLLPGEANFGKANSVFVSDDNDVYIAGENSSGPVYWKNGLLHILKNNIRQGAATSIFVQDEDVYIAGYDNKNVATYWKNGVPHILYDSTKTSSANSIFVKDTMVYIAGQIIDNSTSNNPQAAYWVNGKINKLTDGTKFGNALSIFVK